MKKVFTIAFSALLLCGTAVFAQTPNTPQSASVPQPTPALKWKTTAMFLGKIPQGTPASVTFEVTNTGKIPIVLKSVVAGCSCTTAGYTKAPIEPGKTGTVKATYNAQNMGEFNKSIAVTADDGETFSLLLIGEVVTPTGK